MHIEILKGSLQSGVYTLDSKNNLVLKKGSIIAKIDIASISELTEIRTIKDTTFFKAKLACGLHFDAKTSESEYIELFTIQMKTESYNLKHPTYVDNTKSENRTHTFGVIFAAVGILAFFAIKNTLTEENVKPNNNKEERFNIVQLKETGANLITSQGYSCNTIDEIIPFAMSEGFNVYCENFRYHYKIKNKGGNWVVSLE